MTKLEEKNAEGGESIMLHLDDWEHCEDLFNDPIGKQNFINFTNMIIIIKCIFMLKKCSNLLLNLKIIIYIKHIILLHFLFIYFQY